MDYAISRVEDAKSFIGRQVQIPFNGNPKYGAIVKKHGLKPWTIVEVFAIYSASDGKAWVGPMKLSTGSYIFTVNQPEETRLLPGQAVEPHTIIGQGDSAIRLYT